jgi:hypothetical protein
MGFCAIAAVCTSTGIAGATGSRAARPDGGATSSRRQGPGFFGTISPLR